MENIFESDFLNSCCVVSKRKQKNLIPVFMVVTQDKYQLPVLIADSVEEFAQKLGVKKQTALKYLRDKTKAQYITVYIKK